MPDFNSTQHAMLGKDNLSGEAVLVPVRGAVLRSLIDVGLLSDFQVISFNSATDVAALDVSRPAYDTASETIRVNNGQGNSAIDWVPGTRDNLRSDKLDATLLAITTLLASGPAAVRDAIQALPISSPAMTGVPTAPTATLTISDRQIATTAFVHGVIGELAAGYTSANFATDFAAQTTTGLSEGDGLYYTIDRANAAIDARVTRSFVEGLSPAANLSSLSTSDLVEGGRLYFTNARANAAIDARVTRSFVEGLNPAANLSALSTSDLSEGSRLYFTNARADGRANGRIAALVTPRLDAAEANIDDLVSDLSSLSTSDVAEGSRLYFTNGRADGRANVRINAMVTQAFVNALNVNAATIGGVGIGNIARTNIAETFNNNLTVQGRLSDSIGNTRSVARVASFSGTMNASLANRLFRLTGNITCPAGVYAADTLQVGFTQGTARTINRGGSVTMFVNGTNQASATLAARGHVGFHWESGSVVYLTGDVS